MAGKYSKLLLPRIVSTEPSKQQKVEQKKREFLENLAIRPTGAILATSYATIRRQKNSLKDQLSVLEVEVEAIKQLLVDQYDAEEIESLRLANGDTVRTQLEPYIIVENPARFRVWCVGNGLEQSLQLHPSTASSIVKGLLLKGQPEPDGVRAYFHSKAVFSPNNKNDEDDDE